MRLRDCVQAGKQILARAPFAVGTGPHVVARLGGDDQFVAIGMEILLEQCAEVFFGRAGRRTVVVGEVEVRDAEIEGAAGNGASVLENVAAPPKLYHQPSEMAGSLSPLLPVRL